MQFITKYFFVFLLGVCVNTFSQSNRGQQVIGGNVTNEGRAMEGATVVLQKIEKKQYTTFVSDAFGSYRFTAVEPGLYIIEVTVVGFLPYRSDTLLVGPGNHLKHDVKLTPANTMLDEVVVKSKKDKVTLENGRLVLNVRNSALTTGITAFDVLKNLPGVSVGQDEEILLRGTSGVNIMLDGKMSYVSGKQLVALLKSMPAENLSRMELITAPAAEFDAAGNAGIINIVTKTKKTEGYSIDLRSAITKGKYWMVNKNITALANLGKFTFNASFDFNTPHAVMESKSGSTIIEGGSTLQLKRKNESAYKIKFYTYKLGMDWSLTPRHQLSVQYHGYLDDFKSTKNGEIIKYRPDGVMHSRMVATNHIIEPYYYDAVNLSHVFNMDSSGKKWTTDLHYIGYRNHSDALMRTTAWQTNNGTSKQEGLQSYQPGFIKILSAKTDMVIPYKNYQFKGGLKYARITNDNQFRFDSLQGGSFTEATTMSNHFTYEENISAAYFSVSRKFTRTSIEAGLRVEYTYAKGHTTKEDSSNVWSYTKPFPSLSMNHSFNDLHTINVSVSRRINRPGYADLNPVRWYNDPYFYYSGNPDLVPEMAWLGSVAYTFKRKYVFTATYGHRQHYLTRRLVIDPQSQAIKSQSANFRNMDRVDFLLSVPVKFTDSWDLQLNAGANYTAYPITQLTGFKTLSTWAANLQVQQEIQLPYGVQFEMNAYLYSDELWGLYKKEQVFFADLGLKKSFLTDKLILQVTVGDFLRTNRYKGRSQSNVTDYHYFDRPDTHRFGLSLRYHLGGHLVGKKTNRTEEQDRL